MINADAKQFFDRATGAMVKEQPNFASARVDLEYAAEEWPDQCDLHRALAFVRTRSGGPAITPDATVELIYKSVSTFDELVAASPTVYEMLEDVYVTQWRLPVVPIALSLATRGDVHAAYAAQMIESGRFDDAFQILADGDRATVARSENAGATTRNLAAIRCVLYYRTSRWDDLITAAGALASTPGTTGTGQAMAALGNAFIGTGLAHLGSHEAAQQKLEYAASMNTVASAWASLQLGLSYRTGGDEDKAQKAFSLGMQYETLPELGEAMRNKNQRMRITAPEVIAARTEYWSPESEPDVADFQRQASQGERREALDKALRAIDELDGMEAVKEQIHQLSDEVAFDNEKRQRGMDVKAKTRHMIFKGPPGTGKTTIANFMADVFYGYGVTRTNTLVQADRSTLVGDVEGASAQKTLAKLTEARGGVIFIDEAYDLVQDRGGHADPFGTEALTTLLNYMDVNRDDLIVIIGGYEAPIERFLRENPGLKSRFARSVSFTTYSPDEVWRILLGMARRDGRTVDPAVEDRFKEVVNIMLDTDARGERVLDVAGNGRFARNVFEQAQSLSAKRLMRSGADLSSLSNEQFMQLHYDDIMGAAGSILHGYGLVNV